MKEQVYKELKQEFKAKTNNTTLFEDFCYKYIIETINDSELLTIVNSKNRDLNNLKVIDYFENKNVLLRAIKVLALLEVSKDFKNFLRLYKSLKSDKNNNTVEFDKVLLEFIK